MVLPRFSGLFPFSLPYPDSLLLIIPFRASSLSSFVFCVTTYLPPYHHLRACRSLCIRRRRSLSSPSQFSRQPKPQFPHRHRHCASLKHTNPPSTLLSPAPLSTVSPSLTTTWSPKLSSPVPHIRHRSPPELRNPSDCRRDQSDMTRRRYWSRKTCFLDVISNLSGFVVGSMLCGCWGGFDWCQILF